MGLAGTAAATVAFRAAAHLGSADQPHGAADETMDMWVGGCLGGRHVSIQRSFDMQRLEPIVLAFGLVCWGMAGAHGQSQYPDVARFADKWVKEVQDLSCRDLAARLTHRPVRDPNDHEIIRALHEDARIRQAFIDRAAAPMINKMIDCRMVPDDW
jgi:hypothetical protein